MFGEGQSSGRHVCLEKVEVRVGSVYVSRRPELASIYHVCLEKTRTLDQLQTPPQCGVRQQLHALICNGVP